MFKIWDCKIIKCICKYIFKEFIFKVFGIFSRWVKNKFEYFEKMRYIIDKILSSYLDII